jgi:GAF domain-containing protein
MDPTGAKPGEINLEWNPLMRERRRRVRHKVHTPAYASLTGTSSGIVLELNEILDINEGGMSIHTPSPLEPNQSLNLCLDLSETKSYIHTSAQVVWSDSSGRSGACFPEMPDESLRRLKEWLFLNTITACDHATARVLHQPSKVLGTPTPANSAAPQWESRHRALAIPEYAAVLTALAAIERKVESSEADLDASLQLIVERALTFTGARGAAIALAQGSEMVCAASAGSGAPGLGARLNAGTGFSGECVRTGMLLRCDDCETDPRVDVETCRGLGIRSMLAAPLHLGDVVVGLIEIFSEQANAFGVDESDILRRLSQITVVALSNATRSSSVKNNLANASPVGLQDHPAAEAPVSPVADRSTPSPPRKILLYAVLATLAGASIWLVGPWVERRPDMRTGDRADLSTGSKPQTLATKTAAPIVTDAKDPGGLRQLAEQGDATAQFAMGVRYATGDEVAQSYPEAVRWFSMAAEQGHIQAQGTLGAYYQFGRGVPEDLSKAYFWAVLAAAGGDEISRDRVASLASRMPRVQVIAARQQANEWLTHHQLESRNTPASR